MTIEKAIRLLIEQHSKDLQKDYIHDPVAHALYAVWREADEDYHRKERRQKNGKG